MKKNLIFDLMGFALSRKSTLERVRYVVLGFVFYPFLVKSLSAATKAGDSAASSQAGDDIYPLF